MYSKENFNENNQTDNVSRVALGSDHGGFISKEILKKYLEVLGYSVTDLGTYTEESVDYPDFAVKVAQSVARGESERGIMIDGAGIGSSMVCNKVRGIRAALCYDIRTIKNSRLH
jgi:RpiB/LacA/LacB family sugar-phosphate isomerase